MIIWRQTQYLYLAKATKRILVFTNSDILPKIRAEIVFRINIGVNILNISNPCLLQMISFVCCFNKIPLQPQKLTFRGKSADLWDKLLSGITCWNQRKKLSYWFQPQMSVYWALPVGFTWLQEHVRDAFTIQNNNRTPISWRQRCLHCNYLE